MSTIRTTLAVGLLIVAATNNQLKAQTVKEIVKKHLEAIGGADKWKSVNSVRLTGDFISSEGSKVLFTYTVSDKKGIRKDYTYATTGATANVVVTPAKGWSYIPQPGLRVRPEEIAVQSVDRLKYSLNAQDPLIDYKKKGNVVTYVGKEKTLGVQCYKLQVSSETNKDHTEFLFIDTSNYYNVQISMIGADGEMALIHYSNFKKTPEGLIFPMTFDEGAGSQNINKLEINIPVDPKIFSL